RGRRLLLCRRLLRHVRGAVRTATRARPPHAGRAGLDSTAPAAERHGMTITAITHAHVVPIEGEPFEGTVLVEDGRIAALGPELEIPADAEIHDAAGGWLLPRVVDAPVHLGAAGEGGGRGREAHKG